MRLSLDLLGTLRITLDENPVQTLESAKVRALLAFLALEQDKSHTRDELIGLLWAEHSQERARRNLRHALWNLNQVFKNLTNVLLTTRETIQFNPEYDAQVDVVAFRALLAECQAHPHRALETCRACLDRLERAIALYRGEFLQGFFVADAPAFEEWVVVQREHLQRLVITALNQVTAYHEQRGAAGQAETLRYARRHIELEAWGEEPYRALMRTYAAQNQTEQALAAYHTLASVLHHELGLEPSAETNALYKHLRNQNQSTVNSQQSTVSNLQSPSSSLPLPTTPLVGRETELAQLAEKITRADCRLLTLVGQGGIGKTRLAIQSARENRSTFPRGVYFVDLVEIDSPEMIPNALADALQIRFQGAQSSAQQIVEQLQNIKQPLLLVMDNFEQLLSPSPLSQAEGLGINSIEGQGAPFVSELLKRAPQVTVLVTSRERLNLQGEWIVEVEGLRAPTILPTHVPDDWDAPEAVQLLVQCAARANIHAQTWSDDEKRAAIRITQLVEGMPLAIELASAWLRTLTPIEIAAEIETSLDLLASTQRDLPKRHAGIRAVFEHSWELLTPQEQNVFARLAVFRGGIPRDAARQVAGASLQSLSALVDKSLVKRVAAGRFRLHELVRQFAAEKLALSANAEQNTAIEIERGAEPIQQAHAHFFLNLLTLRGQALNRGNARDALAELRREAENIRAAWQWAVQHTEIAALQQSVAALANFYQAAGLIQEGEVLFRETLATLERVEKENTMPLMSEINAHLANHYLAVAEYPQAIHAAQQALEGGRATGTVASQVLGEWLLGVALDRHTRDPLALTHFEHARQAAQNANLPILEAQILLALADPGQRHFTQEVTGEMLGRALELAEADDEQRLTSNILMSMAQAANHQGKLAEADTLLQRILPLKRRLGDAIGELRAYMNLGTLAVFQYQLDKAQSWYSQAVTLADEVGAQASGLHALVNLGGSKWVAGDYDAARHDYQEALTRGQELGEMWAMHNALWGFIAIENAVGTPDRVLEYAQRYFTLAVSIRDEYEIAFARIGLAYAREAQRQLAEAETLYREAMRVLREREAQEDALRCVAGLARLALARGETTKAHALASELLDALTAKLPSIEVEPLRLYLTCYQILSVCADARATTVLQTAHQLLHRQAAAIENPILRSTFLEHVPWHREIENAYQKSRDVTP